MKFAKGSEQNYTDEIFRIVKVIHRTSRPVYELEELNGNLIEGQIHGEEHNLFASLKVPFIKYIKS